MTLRLAAIGDLHATSAPALPERRGDIGETLLLRAVNRINQVVRPDIVLLLGDLIDQGGAASARQELASLRAIVDRLECPSLVLPGNHDGPADAFFEVFARPPALLDIKGVRLLPFLDPAEPLYNGRRTPEDLARMAAARAGFDGPIVALQHMSVCPPGGGVCPYNLTNAGEVIEQMRRGGIGLSIGAHDHRGFDLAGPGDTRFVAVPALCESPFAFLEIEIEADRTALTRHELRMPVALRLFDWHVHTQFAYCGQNMDIARAAALATDFGLAGLMFAEHSGQLYVDPKRYWGWRGACFPGGISGTAPADSRVQALVGAYRGVAPANAQLGLEVDCEASGQPVLRPEDRPLFGTLIGAIHDLPELRKEQPDMATAEAEFLAAIDGLSRTGIRVLAHPFRLFRKRGGDPPRLFAPVVRILRERGIAAEINFHGNDPSPEFAALCIESGVKLTLGSDAHNLADIGEFTPHLRLLRQCGVDGGLEEVLWH